MTLPTVAGVQSRIYTLPGRPPFMLADDLAEFYQTTPLNLMRQMRRNIRRFPEGFVFELTDEEIALLVCQNGRPNKVNRGVLVGFTEKGALQLASVLTGQVADSVSVILIEAFIALRDGQVASLRRELAIDKWTYIGKSVLRRRIMAAAEGGDNYTTLHGRWTYSHRALIGEIEAMRVRGFLSNRALTPPPYVLRDLAEKNALMTASVEDTRQMRLGLEG